MANFSDDPYDLLDEEKEDQAERTADQGIGTNIPKKVEPELDELPEPTPEELEQIELEEEFGGKN